MNTVACFERVHKAADEIRITISFRSCGAKKINELVITSNKLSNFGCLVTNDLTPGVACGPLVGPRVYRTCLGNSSLYGAYRGVMKKGTFLLPVPYIEPGHNKLFV